MYRESMVMAVAADITSGVEVVTENESGEAEFDASMCRTGDPGALG